MKDLKKYTNEELVELVKQGKIEMSDFVDSRICPTCFDRENNNVLYGDNTDKIIYEDEKF